VTLCVVCTVHKEMRRTSFLVEPQNQGGQFVSGLTSKPRDGFLRFGIKTGGDSFSRFGLKTGGDGFPVWALKPAAMFGDLCLKIIVTVFWFRPQNQADFSLSVTSQN
jgi:hypothetical protein